MKVLNNQDAATTAYLAAVAEAVREREQQTLSAYQKHESRREAAGGRFAIDICHAFCELCLNGTEFLAGAEQHRLWDTNLERDRFFGRQIKTWEGWERTRHWRLTEWTAAVNERLRARTDAWISSDRVLAAELIAQQRRFFQTTLEARRRLFVTICGDSTSRKLAARKYLGVSADAGKECDSSLVKAFDAWTLSRSQATVQLSGHEDRIYIQLGLAGSNEIVSYEARFRKQLETADSALEIASSLAARIEQEQAEAAGCIFNETAKADLIAPPLPAQA
jgi:hypothetical protein